MGIPKFFKWLTRRYPLVLTNIQKEEDCPPNDNLYLDLNGIVHNCIHGNDSKRHERVSKLGDLEEVWANIMKAIDEIVHIVKPRKVLLLAVDGVAPRAKMNQQRARRFRANQDALLLREQMEREGKEALALFDSNAISPGTEFMYQLCRQLEYFVQYKLNTDPLYQHLEKVVVSDGSVPGEGEHKMMDYIRQLRLQPDYDPNTRHCFYGADADLIMLSLLTHEPHFYIIREEHIVKKVKQGGVQRIDLQKTNNFQLIYISILREYIDLEYSVLAPKMKMKFDLERIIDDFVFFCFFIGNDFLPSLSALDISEGSLDILIDFYKELLPTMDQYITESGKIYWDRAEPFIQLLGKNEKETFQKRVHTINQKREMVISIDSEMQQQIRSAGPGGANSGGGGQRESTNLVKFKIKDKIQQKKVQKIQGLVAKGGDKKYKKFLLIKKFEEDELLDQDLVTPQDIETKKALLQKYKELRKKSQGDEHHKGGAKGPAPTTTDDLDESILEVLHGIKDDYLSDLRPDEIPDEHIDEITENEMDLQALEDESANNLQSNMTVQQQLADKYAQENVEFMKQFISQYSQDPEQGKSMYYNIKVHIDVSQERGDQEKKKMLKKYLEGLQWVLYYYYKGAQHWRWYYPYHYAPMISDLGSNIVHNFLNDNVTIDTFEVDYNCAADPGPYTPYQQLLCILPERSIEKILPQYLDLVRGDLAQYFPQDFEIDLNGKTLPWEAACLIPFADEVLFIKKEEQLLKQQNLSEHDQKRNTISFDYQCFSYDKNAPDGQSGLQSTLTQFDPLPQNLVKKVTINDYANVGKLSFSADLHPKLVLPNPDYPSLRWLKIKEIVYDTKYIQDVPFKRVIVNVPISQDEASAEAIEKYAHNFARQPIKELYVDYPFQYEAFPIAIEDEHFIYEIYGEQYSNSYNVHKVRQPMNLEQFTQRLNRNYYKLFDKGIGMLEMKALVTLNRVNKVNYDSHQCVYFKEYEQDFDIVPLSLLMRKRDVDHYLNVNKRVLSLPKSFQTQKDAVSLDRYLFGIIGQVDKVDQKSGEAIVIFDKQSEDAKIHDPYVGHTILEQSDQTDNNVAAELDASKRFYTEQQIEKSLKLKFGVVNKLTSSVLITFNDKQTRERMVLDLGLNVKNFTKRVHIPDYVRFTVDEEAAANQYDDYTHNSFARGAKHIRKHWQYSQECYDIIKQYSKDYPEVFDCIAKNIKNYKQFIVLKDLYPHEEQIQAAARVKQIATWIEGLPLSKLPYVEMGFDTLNTGLIYKIDQEQKKMKQNSRPITVQYQEKEKIGVNFLFQEQFPYWSPPYAAKRADDFKVGDRVMNLNSIKREYVPFGLRGTVVGKTNDKVIVLFDAQFLSGNNIYGHCQEYRGAFVEPAYLLNLTRKFNQIARHDPQVVDQFIEQPAGSGDGKTEEELKESHRVVVDRSKKGGEGKKDKSGDKQKQKQKDQDPTEWQQQQPSQAQNRNDKKQQQQQQRQQPPAQQTQNQYQPKNRQPQPQYQQTQKSQQQQQPQRQQQQQQQQFYKPKQQQNTQQHQDFDQKPIQQQQQQQQLPLTTPESNEQAKQLLQSVLNLLPNASQQSNNQQLNAEESNIKNEGQQQISQNSNNATNIATNQQPTLNPNAGVFQFSNPFAQIGTQNTTNASNTTANTNSGNQGGISNDFQNLLNLMSLASQMQAQVPNVNVGSNQEQQQDPEVKTQVSTDGSASTAQDNKASTFDVNATTFVPAWKR